MSDSTIRNNLSKKISSLSFDKDDLRKLLNILQLRANAASEIEYKKFEAFKAENLENIKRDLDYCAILMITVTGYQNEELFGTIDDVFNSVSFPEQVKTIYVNSELRYREPYKYYPINSFTLFVDFSKPKVFDFSFQPNERTPNDSQFEVQGSDNTWVNGVFHEIDAYIRSRPSKFSKAHRGSIYDFLVWFFGIPFGFYVCYKVIQLHIPFLAGHSFFESILLTYCFFLSLFILRILFHYFRWVYPMIEYKNKKERSIGHQAALLSITLGIIGKIIYDAVKFLFT
ncbi:MAG: hypothetical protein KA821_11325 [Chitinophagaceae bacterium]|nr:hypothetical protein [Chitinophagaceae bacterium]